MDIPEGWTLVPNIPTERMLTEFAGIWSSWLPKDRRDLELRAYSAMLQVCPSAPTSGPEEIQSLRAQIDRLTEEVRVAKHRAFVNHKKNLQLREQLRNRP